MSAGRFCQVPLTFCCLNTFTFRAEGVSERLRRATLTRRRSEGVLGTSAQSVMMTPPALSTWVRGRTLTTSRAARQRWTLTLLRAPLLSLPPLFLRLRLPLKASRMLPLSPEKRPGPSLKSWGVGLASGGVDSAQPVRMKTRARREMAFRMGGFPYFCRKYHTSRYGFVTLFVWGIFWIPD